MAKAGFYYYNQSDRVSCAWCHGVIAKWEVGDNPFAEHEKFFPQCPRVGLGPNIEITADENIGRIENIGGIQPIRPPKREGFSTLDARIRTFTNWPLADVQPVEQMASAGFYYKDTEDHVRCFHCNGGLRQWQRDDDPWYEHAKWFPKCKFVELVKGAQFVADVQHQTQPRLDAVMVDNEAVQRALQMGLDEGRIRAATKNQLAATGRPYQSVEMLVAAVLDNQCEEELSESNAGNGETNETPSTWDGVFHAIPSSVPSQTVAAGFSRSVCVTQEADDDKQPTEMIDDDVEASTVAATIKTEVVVEVPEEKTALSVASDQTALEEENRQLKDARLCKVCMDDDVGVVFLPCGHLGILHTR